MFSQSSFAPTQQTQSRQTQAQQTQCPRFGNLDDRRGIDVERNIIKSQPRRTTEVFRNRRHKRKLDGLTYVLKQCVGDIDALMHKRDSSRVGANRREEMEDIFADATADDVYIQAAGNLVGQHNIERVAVPKL